MMPSTTTVRLLLLVALCTASNPATLRATPSVAIAQHDTETQDSQPKQAPPADEPAPEPDWTEQQALVDARILDHLELPSSPPVIAPARAPPEPEFAW